VTGGCKYNEDKVKIKGEVLPRTRHEGPEEEYNNSFFNLGSRWGGWSKPRPGLFTLGKVPGPII
jgi:hypothetical protein